MNEEIGKDEIRDEEILDPEEITTADGRGVIRMKERQIQIESGTPLVPEATQSIDIENSRPIATTATGAATAARAKAQEDLGPLFSVDEANNLRARWDSVQVAFVDEPRQAVEDADALVASTMKRLTDIFSAERQKLERQLDQGDNASTEDLRVALRRYRSFFSRLLNV